MYEARGGGTEHRPNDGLNFPDVRVSRTRASGNGPSFAVSVYLVSRAATLLAAAGIALISATSIGAVSSRWDGGWYLSIVRHGYPSVLPAGTGPAAQSSVAFFPGYPMLVRSLSSPTGLPPVLVGVIVSLLAGLAAAAGLWHLAVRLSDEDAADRAVVLFAFLPSAFVMSMVYADALFLALAVWCLIALLDGRWAVAGSTAAMAGLVRPTAVALCVACAWSAVVSIRENGSWRALIAPALAPWGGLLYLGYLWIHTGHPFAFFDVEARGWGNRFDAGVANIRRALGHLAEAHMTFFVAEFAIVVGGIAVGSWLLARWHAPGSMAVYVAVVLGLAMLGSNPVSFPRFLLAAFPALVPLARRISFRTAMAIAAVSAVLMTTHFFVTGLSHSLPP
jgi:hypothetical protein